MKYTGILWFILCVLLSNCSEPIEWDQLLDEDLSQWEIYLSYQHKEGYDGKKPTNESGNIIEPIGHVGKENPVFTVEKLNGDLILKVNGEIYGCIYTKKEYQNYHLSLQVKWGNKKWEPRENLLKDSGILYHSIGEPGVDHWRSWMLSQEFQIMEGHMGDYWNIANSAIDIRAYIPEYVMNPIANETQPFLSLGAGTNQVGFGLRSENLESSNGKWTTLELICFEDKSLHVVNGQVVMVLQNSRYFENETYFPLTKGKIQLQSEAAEVYYKNIKIRSIDKMPDKFSRLYID